MKAATLITIPDDGMPRSKQKLSNGTGMNRK